MEHSDLDEERPSIIEQVVFYTKPGISKTTKEDLFDQRRKSQRLKLTFKSEPEELFIKSELNIKTEEEEILEQEQPDEETEIESNLIIDETPTNVVEILPSDVSDNTKDKITSKTKPVRVYTRKVPNILKKSSANCIIEDVPQEGVAVKKPRGRPPKNATNRTITSPGRDQSSISNQKEMAFENSEMKRNIYEDYIIPNDETGNKYSVKKKKMFKARLESATKMEALTNTASNYLQKINEPQSDSKDLTIENSTNKDNIKNQNNSSSSKTSLPVKIISIQTVQAFENFQKKIMIVQTNSEDNQDLKNNFNQSQVHKSLRQTKSDDNIFNTKMFSPRKNNSDDKILNNKSSEKPNKSIEPNSPKKPKAVNDVGASKLTSQKQPVESKDHSEVSITSATENDATYHSDDDYREGWAPPEYVYRQQHSSKVFRCEECNEDFLTKDDIASHLEKTNHKTSLENEVTESQIDLDEDDDRSEWIPEDYAEYKLKHGAAKKRVFRIFKCKICMEIFKSYYLLCKHRVVHFSTNPYECRQCDAAFNDLEEFTAHIRLHQGKNPYPCKKCDMGFMTKDELTEHSKLHILKKNPPKVKRFRCDICGKEFSKLCDMERHTRVHTGEKPAECNICHKRFQQTHNLSKHLLTHLQVKPFQCDLCNKKFGRVDVLNRHLLTHSLDKPFKCVLCPKGFIRLVQYQGHMSRCHPNVEYAECEETNVDMPMSKEDTPRIRNELPSESENQREEDPDNDLEIHEDRVDIIPIGELEQDKPDRENLKTELADKNDSRPDLNEDLVADESAHTIDLQETEESPTVTNIIEVYSPHKGFSRRRHFGRCVSQYVEIERVAHTNDPNIIMERILNPQEDVTEQIIDEIN